MDLHRSNGELYAEFTRLTGGDSFAFPGWWAKQVREASLQLGRAEFSRMTKKEQHEHVLAHLRSQTRRRRPQLELAHAA